MRKWIFSVVISMLLTGVSGLGLTVSAKQEKLPVTSLDRLSQPGISIAVAVDTPAESSLKQDYPGAKIIPYNDIFLAYLDVANGRVDACVAARREMEFAIQHGFAGVRLLEEDYSTNRIAVGISPVSAVPDLKEKLNAFIAEKKSDGTLDDMYDRWVTRGEETMPDIPPAEDAAFTLRVGTTGTVMPYSYYIGKELAGYDIELAYRFASWIGAEPELKVYDFGGIIPAAEAGSIDCIMSNLFYTEEKDEAIPFSDVLFEVKITAMVRDESYESENPDAADTSEQAQSVPGSGSADEGSSGIAALKAEEPAATAAGKEGDSFRAGVKASFEKTFIREERWRLFADGVRTTLLITLLAILSGTALGFIVFMLCRNGNIFANTVTRFCIWLVQGMPMVVLLMILYYIIFGSVVINGTVVAVIGFTLTFGSSVFGLLKLGVGAVDNGQYEAAYSLGYSSRRTFFRIILPQALPHVLPSYKGEVVGLIKATSIVGYIAVQDLTKMGDIVRSRTYEAFFPLIAVTIIYFVLEGLLRFLVSCIHIRIDPGKRRREMILKGVNVHD